MKMTEGLGNMNQDYEAQQRADWVALKQRIDFHIEHDGDLGHESLNRHFLNDF